MASRTTNDSVQALRDRHRAQQEERVAQERAEAAAVGLVADAEAAVAVARQRRADVLADLDASVVGAEQSRDVALTVLAAMLGDDEAAASITGVDVATVRTARRRSPDALVRARAAELRAVGQRRRGGRRPGRQVQPVGTAAAVAEPVVDSAGAVVGNASGGPVAGGGEFASSAP